MGANKVWDQINKGVRVAVEDYSDEGWNTNKRDSDNGRTSSTSTWMLLRTMTNRPEDEAGSRREDF